MEPFTLVLLMVAAFAAAFFDSIVGGGGVISLPALLAVGMDPYLALGTNKLAATGASFIASIRYVRAGVVQTRLVLWLIPFSVVASFFGVLTALQVDGRFLSLFVLGAMGLVTAYVLLHPGLGAVDRHLGMVPWRLVAMMGAATLIGFYDGFLGPGTGTFLIFAFLGLQRFDFLGAAGHGRVLNFTSNLGSLALFVLLGHVDFAVGIPMFVAMMAGGWFGSHVGITQGAKWIRPLFVVVTGGLMVRILYRLVQGF